ncbi:hypothetical protein NBRC111894_630 [Sporolactobacillus inulinus]|uniref:Uncharacterized protein n=1 Tax=Sporolactobacillus inulinus TaxID=2078 RepID=A0A4Y1Z800_9BACL|nr:hypothetical protein NBRC111894_630 [Sporolactobacillus inulinus]
MFFLFIYLFVVLIIILRDRASTLIDEKVRKDLLGWDL